MLFPFFTRKLNAGLALAMALAPLTVAGLASHALASDLDYSRTAPAGDGHFVRIGLNKSVVIRLPEDAKDVIVGDPSIVDAVVRTRNTAYLFARAVGQTNIFFFDAKGRQIMNVDLEVALDMTALQKLIQRTIPNSKITVDSVAGSVVLKGTAANAVDAKLAEDLAGKFAGDPAKVVDAMSISSGDQVMLKVRVVEIKRDILKQLGINLDNIAFEAGNFAFNMVTKNPLGLVYQSATGSYHNGSTNIDATIRAMEKDGVVHTLAEPTLAAVSGQVANFHAGGEFPYVSGVSCAGTAATSCTNIITYKPFGVMLGFTPTVLSEGRISIKVNTEVSEVADAETGALDTRSADTTLELPSGGSMMLAGLIKDQTDQAITGTPGLKNVPVLGALFRSRTLAASQTELVVIVTPYIVNAVAEKELATPGDSFRPANDGSNLLFGRLNQVYGAPGNHPDGVYHGTVGFIVE